MSESQVRQLARSRSAVPLVEVRAPAAAIVLARNIALKQRIERGGGTLPPRRHQPRLGAGGRVRAGGPVRQARYGCPRPLRRPGSAGTRQRRAHPVRSRKPYLRVRLELDNRGYRLRPDMFVDVEFPLQLPAALTVPVDAIIDAGRRKTIYVETGEGRFEPRLVETGRQFGDRVAITSGLAAGERIVVSGTFLIDSESRLRLAALGAQTQE